MFKNKILVLNVPKLVLTLNDTYDNYLIKHRENNTFYNKIIGTNLTNKKE
jgi:hypothetical protein